MLNQPEVDVNLCKQTANVLLLTTVLFISKCKISILHTTGYTWLTGFQGRGFDLRQVLTYQEPAER